MSIAVSQFMTSHPHTIGADQPAAVARRMMSQHHIRHLPVLRGGDIVGVLTDRDLQLADGLKGNPAPTVEDLMMPDPFVASSTDPLSRVAGKMASHKYGCAVIADSGVIKGVFTVVDACRALEILLGDDADGRVAPRRRRNLESAR